MQKKAKENREQKKAEQQLTLMTLYVLFMFALGKPKETKPMNPNFGTLAAECLGLAALFAAGYVALLLG